MTPFAGRGSSRLCKVRLARLAQVGYINSDLTLYIHRLPEGEWIGLEVVDHGTRNFELRLQSIRPGWCHRLRYYRGPSQPRRGWNLKQNSEPVARLRATRLHPQTQGSAPACSQSRGQTGKSCGPVLQPPRFAGNASGVFFQMMVSCISATRFPTQRCTPNPKDKVLARPFPIDDVGMGVPGSLPRRGFRKCTLH